MKKKDVICDIIKAYRHDTDAEGEAISKRRLWYILKPQFANIDLTNIFHQGKPVQPITNADYNKHFNTLAEDGEIDDIFIRDNSRTIVVGERLPHIIIAAEKKTIEPTALNLAEKLGCSCYIAGGFSSIYAAKKMMEETGNDVVVLMMSDYDKAGYEIQNTVSKHFNGCEVHRALITPEQIPEDRKDEFFAESVKLGKHYELDVLNIHELADTFLTNIPEHIAVEIKEAYEVEHRTRIQYWRVQREVDANEELQALRAQVEALETALTEKYESAFMEADPITFSPFNTEDIYNETVDYNIKEWK